MSKKLYRSNENRILFGVAGGLGEYFEVDPVWVRLALVVLALMGGPGLLAYLIMWLVVPRAPALPPGQEPPKAFQPTNVRQL